MSSPATAKNCARFCQLDPRLIDQLEISLVHERRGFERVPGRLATKVAPGDEAQLGIYQRRQLVERLAIARAPSSEQLSDAVVGHHRFFPDLPYQMLTTPSHFDSPGTWWIWLPSTEVAARSAFTPGMKWTRCSFSSPAARDSAMYLSSSFIPNV